MANSNVTVSNTCQQKMFPPVHGAQHYAGNYTQMMTELPRLYIAEHRAAYGLSQEALAEAAEVSRGLIAILERNKKNVTLEKLTQIATAMNIETIDLFNPPQKIDPDVQRGAEYLAKIKDPSERKSAINILRSLSERSNTAYNHDDPDGA